MCPVAKGAKHEPAPIPEEGKWVHSKKIEDISGFTHGVGWCAPQQGACKLYSECKRRYHRGSFDRDNRMFRYDSFRSYGSRDSYREKQFLEALNTDLVCDAINTAMRELFLTDRIRTYSECFL